MVVLRDLTVFMIMHQASPSPHTPGEDKGQSALGLMVLSALNGPLQKSLLGRTQNVSRSPLTTSDQHVVERRGPSVYPLILWPLPPSMT